MLLDPIRVLPVLVSFGLLLEADERVLPTVLILPFASLDTTVFERVRPDVLPASLYRPLDPERVL